MDYTLALRCMYSLQFIFIALSFILYHNLQSVIFLAFSLFTTSCNHSLSVNSIALLFSLPFALMKTYCYLAETSVSFSNFRTAEQGFVLLSSCWLVLQNKNVVGLWTISGLGQRGSHVHFHSHSGTPTNSTPALQPHCFAARFENELLACSPVHQVHK